MGEKVTLAEAAKRIDRSVPTLRRWAAQGHLAKHDGPRAAGGRGSPLVLVDMDEVLLRAVALGLQMEPAKQPEPEPPEQPAMPSSGDGDPTVADLRAELEAARTAQREAEHNRETAELRGQIATLEAHLAGLEARLEGLDARLLDAQRLATDLRAEREHFREMVTAKDAELEQLRAVAARGWFSRVFGLLSGPTDG